MHTVTIAKWQHTHIFGQNQIRSGERRTLTVLIITALMMVVEIVAGAIFGSMALFADGIHMGSHMVGLGISFIAYIYARKYASDNRFCFGTGKVNALAGYSSAIFLAIIALYMGYESILRFIKPVGIEYNQAILVAVIGLAVNGASMIILGEKGHTHSHEDEHDHGDDHDHDHGKHTHPKTKDADHNLKSAYLHVLTDAMTSVLAIIALLGAKYFNFNWMDPMMGIIGAVLVIRWSMSLIRGSSTVLLDRQSPEATIQKITSSIEGYKDTRISDLHLWCIGPGIYSAALSVVTKHPDKPDAYKKLLPHDIGIVHATVEVHPCVD